MTINEIWEQAKVLSPKERDELVRRLAGFGSLSNEYTPG